jgi:hypothetical protein
MTAAPLTQQKGVNRKLQYMVTPPMNKEAQVALPSEFGIAAAPSSHHIAIQQPIYNLAHAAMRKAGKYSLQLLTMHHTAFSYPPKMMVTRQKNFVSLRHVV